MTVTFAPVPIQKFVDRPFRQSVTDHGSLLSEITPKKRLLSGCSGVLFMDGILFFDLHACWKCLFFPHFLQIVSFAGHISMSMLGLFPYLEHIVCLDGQLPRPVSEYSYMVSWMSSQHQLGIVLCRLHEENLFAGEPFLTAEYMSQPFPE